MKIRDDAVSTYGNVFRTDVLYKILFRIGYHFEVGHIINGILNQNVLDKVINFLYVVFIVGNGIGTHD